MWSYILFKHLFLLVIFYKCYCFFENLWKQRNRPKNTKTVPLVSGRFPIVGNGLAFSKDIIGYIRECYRKYGPIFRLKIFNREMIVVCDRSLTEEYFRKKEKDMSLNRVLDRLYFANAFADDSSSLDTIIRVVKQTVKVDFDVFAPKIMDEAKKMVVQMKQEVRSGKKVNLQNQIIKFIARTSSRCFVSFDITDEFFETLMEFSHLLNKIVVLTYFVPKWILKLIYNPKLRKLRMKLIDGMDSTIELYRKDLNKRDSLVIRRAVDMKDIGNTGRNLTNREIGEILVCLLYVSSENTALGLTSLLLDLSRNPEYWKQVKEATKNNIKTEDYRNIFAEKILDACVMESARLNSHIFALNRQPMSGINTLGNYFVGDVDSVALCEPMLMVYEAAHDKFHNPEKYNPYRFIDDDEKSDARSVMTWGAGEHLCPGKMFAIYELKAGAAMITNAFKCFSVTKSRKDYFSPSAFAESTADVNIEVLEEDEEVKEQIEYEIFAIGNKKVKCYSDGDNKGWLIEDYLTNNEQMDLYKYTVSLGKETEEWKKIVNTSESNPCPLVFDNLVYTGTSNCTKPEQLKQWYDLANKIWCELKTIPNFCQSDKKFNSFYSQLFGPKSYMKRHKDQYVDWGVSVSIGASCEFSFGKHTINLHSGSIFVADFSKSEHEVIQIYDNTTPGWFDLEESMNRTRLSVQIRAIDKPVNIMNTEQFRELINK
jgi:cytochrome P450